MAAGGGNGDGNEVSRSNLPDIHVLISDIEAKDRKYKVATGIFGAMLFLGLIVLLLIGIHTLQGVDTQLVQQKSLLNSQRQVLGRIQSSAEQRTKQINQLQQHIDCITELFQQPNRAYLSISDLASCKLSGLGVSINRGGSQYVASSNTTDHSGTAPGAPASAQSAAPVPAANRPSATAAPTQAAPLAALFCKVDLFHLSC